MSQASKWNLTKFRHVYFGYSTETKFYTAFDIKKLREYSVLIQVKCIQYFKISTISKSELKFSLLENNQCFHHKIKDLSVYIATYLIKKITVQKNNTKYRQSCIWYLVSK